MNNFFHKYKILLAVILVVLSFFYSNIVKAYTTSYGPSAPDPKAECTIFKYSGGGGYCSTIIKQDYHSWLKNVGDTFVKGEHLSTYGYKEQSHNDAEDSGERLANGNCLDNIEYCYDLYIINPNVINWSDVSNKEIIRGNQETVSVQVVSSTETVKKILCLGLDVTCSVNGTTGATITFPNTLGVGEYKAKVIAITDKNNASAKEVVAKVNPVVCESFDSSQCVENVNCFFNKGDSKCYNKQDNSICGVISEDSCGTAGGSQVCAWSEVQKKCITNFSSSIENRYKKPENYNGPLPDCAFAGSCNDVNQLLQVAINVGEWLFSIIGGLAFVFFVYGGFTMILSFGSAEKFKKGQQILIAAVVGMVIAFGAYALVHFLLNSLGVSQDLIFIN